MITEDDTNLMADKGQKRATKEFKDAKHQRG
jgi:hypothetical protein